MSPNELAQLMLCVGPEDHTGNSFTTNEERLSRITFDLLENSDSDLRKEDVFLDFRYARRPLCVIQAKSEPVFVAKFNAGEIDSTSTEYEILTRLQSVARQESLPLNITSPIYCSASLGAFLYTYVQGEKYSALVGKNDILDKEVLAELGRTLACVHQCDLSAEESCLDDFPRMSAPWPFPCGLISPSQYVRGIGEDFHIFLSLIQELSERHSGLNAEWRSDSIIHGDFRFDNIIIGDFGNPTVIDWELAAVGDRRYDLGYLIAECIFESICQEHAGIGEEWFVRSQIFLRSYYQHLTHFVLDVSEDLKYAFDLTALSLLHKIASLLQHRGQLGRTGYKMLFCVRHILSNSIVLANEMQSAL